ncbi:hypothetical protein YC2023_010741 [Brassica napus]
MELSVNDVKFTPQEFAELIAAMNVTINGKSGKHVTSFCAVGDAVIMQFVNGTGKHVGIRVDYSTAAWLNTERSNQFIVQAYIKGLDYIDLEASSCPLSQDRLLLPIDRSDKVTCTKLQSFIEELKQLIYFTTHMVIVVITKLTFQIVSTGDGGSSWRPRCHQRLSRLLLLQYHWLQILDKSSNVKPLHSVIQRARDFSKIIQQTSGKNNKFQEFICQTIRAKRGHTTSFL